MKKTLFAALALAFVASCSNEEVVEMAQKEAIGFDNAFVDNSTRSVSDPSITNANIASFDVYGFVDKTGKIFEGTDVTGSGTTTDSNASWSYTGTPQYWITDAIYNFCAVAPANVVTATATVSNEEDANNTKNTITTTFNYTNVDVNQNDLLYSEAACVAGKPIGNSDVAFTFRHLLSKVKFSFKNDYNGTNATIKVTGIKITDTVLGATATLTSNSTTWSSNQSGSLTINFGDATPDATTETPEPEADDYAYGTTYESYYEKLIIPSASKEYTIEFVVTLYVSGTEIATYNHTGENAAKVTFEPQAGKSYDINAEINAKNIDPENPAGQEPIQFTVTNITGWTEDNVDDILK